MERDQVQRIEGGGRAATVSRDLREQLRRFANLAPSVDAPYITASFDWRPDAARPRGRQANVQFEQEARDLRARCGARGPAHESVSADIEKIRAYLEGLDPAAHGVVIIACSARDVFEAMPLGVPVPTKLHAAPTPVLTELVRLGDDLPPCAVVLADSRTAFIHLIDQETLRGTVALPRSAQHRYEKRVDEEVAHFVRRLADEAQRVLADAQITLLALAAEDEMAGTLQHEFEAAKLRAQLVGHVHLGVHATEQEVIDAVRPLISRAVQAREAQTVATVQDRLNMGGAAVNGPDEVIASLQRGEVATLVMNDDFSAPGWADYTLPLYGAGEPPEAHPAGGDPRNIVPVALGSEAVRLAIQTDADVVIVRTTVPPEGYVGKEDVPRADAPIPRPAPARALDELRGIAALLRFVS